MLFQSFGFVLFLFLLWSCYWKMPSRYRWCLMLAAGCFYYSLWNFQYTLLVVFVSVITYIAARFIDHRRDRKRPVLIVYIVLELAILCLFKYVGFLGSIVNDILHILGSSKEFSVFQWILPVGISFYIFQTIAYVADVYLGKTPAERHFGYFAESVIFFPILLAGPIEKIPFLTAQFKKEMSFSYEGSCRAFQRILLGYMKKLIIADSLAAITGQIYSNIGGYVGFPLLIAIFLYAIEIYCDFSGYSDIAIGTAGLFGISIHENFKQPYFADSIKDFWKRWHISLTSWFREYVYIPLGGNRVAAWKQVRNVMCVYVLSGLWHGADWTFLAWGGMNGIAQVLENVFYKRKHTIRMPKIIRQVIVFVLVSIMWVFFRMESMADAVFVLAHCFDGVGALGAYLQFGISQLGIPRMQGCLLAAFLLLLFWIDREKEKGAEKVLNGIFVSILLAVGMFYYLRYGIDSSAFIYFQF